MKQKEVHTIWKHIEVTFDMKQSSLVFSI